MKIIYQGEGYKDKAELIKILKRVICEIEEEDLEALSGVADTGLEVYHSLNITV